MEAIRASAEAEPSSIRPGVGWMNVILALAAFSHAHYRSSLVWDAGLFAMDFSEQELGQRAMPVWLFDAEPVRIPPPRRESPEQWADRWLTSGAAEASGERGRSSLATASEHLFQERRQLAPVQRAVLDVCVETGGRPTVALVVLTESPLDQPDILRAMAEAAEHPVFWVFLTATLGDAPDSPGLLDFLTEHPDTPPNFTVLRADGRPSPWTRIRRVRTLRRAVSQWLRGLPPSVLEPEDAEPGDDPLTASHNASTAS